MQEDLPITKDKNESFPLRQEERDRRVGMQLSGRVWAPLVQGPELDPRMEKRTEGRLKQGSKTTTTVTLTYNAMVHSAI